MGAALMFRHASQLAAGSEAQAVSQAPGVEQLLIRHRVGGPALAPPAAAGQKNQSASASGASLVTGDGRHPTTVVTPLNPRESPPQLAESYPDPDPVHSSSWGISMNMLMPVAVPPNDGRRTHKVVDGDTLASLAERFLGSADRAKEIFDANRDVLSDPRLLPISIELKIPPRSKRAE
jgi:nucleoid-associated protein YgaU